MIYLDACMLIYVHEANPIFGRRVANAIDLLGDTVFCISPLVKAECLAGVFRRNDAILEFSYPRFFGEFRTLAMTESTFLLAARIAARTRAKMADALHLACAQESGCAALWTNDDRLSAAAPGYAVNILK